MNSRSSFPDAAFRERCLQPLSHVSKNIPLSYTFLQKFQKMLYYRNPNWPHRLTVRTPGFQSVNQSSILCGVTTTKLSARQERLFCGGDPKRANCFARAREAKDAVIFFQQKKWTSQGRGNIFVTTNILFLTEHVLMVLCEYSQNL